MDLSINYFAAIILLDKRDNARKQIEDGIDLDAIRKEQATAKRLKKNNQNRLNAGLRIINSFEHTTRDWLASANHLAKSAISESESLAKTKMIVCATKLSLFSSLPDKKTH